TIYNLPFRDSISPSSLSGCSFDTVGFRNFTAGPWPRLSVAERGEQPSALPFGGRYMLAFNSFDTRERNEVWLTTPPLRSSGIESVDVSYKWYEDGSDYNTDFFAGEGVKLLWSNDYVNWDTVVSSPRITKYGADGWKYKQVTLPATAAKQPVLYVRWIFLSRWGYNCYFDEPAVIPTQPKPADGVLTYAVAQFTDSLNLKTNYYNGQEQLLLSIQSEADAGHVNDSLQIGVGGGATALKIGQDNNYVRNSGGWGVTGKYWIVNRWKDQPQPVRIFQYYSFQELLSLQNLASTFLPGAPAAEMPLYSYHIQNNHVTPLDPATGHLNQQAALSYGQPGFWQFDSTGLADTLSFTFRPFISGWHMAETLIKNPGGGGMGKGSASGNGALAAHWLHFSGERRDRTTLLNWTTGYERRWVLMTVERASDLDPDFRELGYISPEGWSQKGSEYSFTDREILPNGNYRYRIKAYDTRSKEYLSPEIRIGIDDTRGLVVFPNPVPSGGSINVFSETNMRWLRIIDQMGRVVLMAQPNATQFRAKLPVLATGIYYVQSLLDSGMKTTRLFISP
nr:T9SS type A sorting domain-containing protein [Chitinophagaceae bacterium]